MLLLILLACADPKVPQDTAPPLPGHEFCDGVDNDGDGQVDETFDLDGDGFLADEADCRALGRPTDCDDLDPAIHPDADELCDAVDNDCDGILDDAPDGDGDGWTVCEDCDDDDPFTSPDAAEACDGIDNDCSGLADEPWDEDGDLVSSCGGDCDERDPNVSPLLPEVCDGIDNDCDDQADEGFDQDGDGFTTCMGDCEDTRAEANPIMEEVCDGLDNDCDGTVLEETDPDGDGFNLCDGDCVEGIGSVFPGAPELCNDRDDDCDGVLDTPDCFGCTADGLYLYCTKSLEWDEADEVCARFGRQLALVTDAEENAAVGAAVVTLLGANAWLGASDQATEGTWVWVDGTPLSYTAWATGQPSGGSDDCLVQSWGGTAGAWADERCTRDYPYVCEGF